MVLLSTVNVYRVLGDWNTPFLSMLKLEQLAYGEGGNAGAYWWDFGEQTFNNSWYDPVNNIIHLEYDGKQGWGDTRYYIHREYSNPQFDGV